MPTGKMRKGAREAEINRIIRDLREAIKESTDKHCGGLSVLDRSDRMGARLEMRMREQCRKDAVVDAIGSVFQREFTKCLGGQDEYHIVFDASGNPKAVPNEPRDRGIWHLVDLIPIVFKEYNLDVEDALFAALFLEGATGASYLPLPGRPVTFCKAADVAAAETWLELALDEIFLDMARASVAGMEPTSALTSLKRQLAIEIDKWKGSDNPRLPTKKETRYSIALQTVIDETNREIAWKVDEHCVNASLGENGSDSNNSDGSDKFSIKEAMVLLDYIATTPEVWAKSTHRAKAELLMRLSAHSSPSVDKITNMFSSGNFKEIKANYSGILNVWKERLLPAPKGRKKN